MPELYPFLLQPEFHERPWGARDLSPIYPEVAGEKPIGEAWLTGDTCRVFNGPLAGRTLAELTRQYGRDLVGAACPDPGRFPLLIKFLFPREKLSVQVHPDDEGARRIGQPCGKTECWYVLDAKPGAQVGLGLKPGATRTDFERAIQEKRAEFLLNWIPVHKGDLIYVDAGTVHAIGPGSILVETQQNSDTTYRLYDYGRPRELHIEQGLAATKEKTRAGKVKHDPRRPHTLVASSCFVVNKHRPGRDAAWSDTALDSVRVLVALEGGGRIEVPGTQPLGFNRGEAVVIPAAARDFAVFPQWDLEFLDVTLPSAGAVFQPETTLAAETAAGP